MNQFDFSWSKVSDIQSQVCFLFNCLSGEEMPCPSTALWSLQSLPELSHLWVMLAWTVRPFRVLHMCPALREPCWNSVLHLCCLRPRAQNGSKWTRTDSFWITVLIAEVCFFSFFFLFQLEKLIEKNYFLHKSAQEAYKSYIRAYDSHSLKQIFNVNNLNLPQVALSFGFKVPPFVDLSILCDVVLQLRGLAKLLGLNSKWYIPQLPAKASGVHPAHCVSA